MTGIRRGSSSRQGNAAGGVQAAAEPLVVLWTRSYDDVSHRVSPVQLRVLLVLDREGPLKLTALADALDAIPSSASRLCDRLVAAGLVSRDPDRGDRRVVTHTLTRDGRGLLRELADRREAALGAVLARMPESDRQALLRGLVAFSTALKP